MQVKIVYASMTGNDEDMAEILEEDLQDAGFEVDSSDVSFTDASDYLNADICVFVTYTYGEGKMTDELEDFYDQLKSLDLTGKRFLVMGSGDKTYKDHYCENVFDFEKVFLACGAEEVVKPLTVENAPADDDIAKIDEIADELAEKFNG
ncbi:flavodoxin [Lactobacillus jensenii 1153]|uniref:flavodoxin n=1 Tax=Lactobacillus jensenii TaxID=109790 RepID=UPI0001A4379D|nr:flavodoxin [Lactobacillus jensenii]EEQ25036.1 flavodoxin [Lactobacillus jensenii 269-3]EEQ68702.1 flavodoxin [Lactobacillus jensenii 1153]